MSKVSDSLKSDSNSPPPEVVWLQFPPPADDDDDDVEESLKDPTMKTLDPASISFAWVVFLRVRARKLWIYFSIYLLFLFRVRQ